MNLKNLVAKGKSQGYISYLDLKDCLPEEITENDLKEDIVTMLKDMGIEVRMEKAEVIRLYQERNGDSSSD